MLGSCRHGSFLDLSTTLPPSRDKGGKTLSPLSADAHYLSGFYRQEAIVSGRSSISTLRLMTKTVRQPTPRDVRSTEVKAHSWYGTNESRFLSAKTTWVYFQCELNRFKAAYRLARHSWFRNTFFPSRTMCYVGTLGGKCVMFKPSTKVET